MTFTIEAFDASTADERVTRAVHEAYVDLEHDFFPEDPEPPYEFHLRMWTAPAVMHRKDFRYLAKENGEVIGSVHVALWIDHPRTGLITPAIKREHRGRGAGTALFVKAMDALEANGRSTLIVDIPNGSPGERIAAEMGLKQALSERINQLRVEDIDWGLMQSWVESAKEKAPDYELIFWEPPFPEDQLEQWCQISDVMNTAPLEGLDLEETVMTPEKWRSIETNFDVRGFEARAVVAVHRPTGEFAGMTTILAQRHHPAIAQQDDTVVHPDHRGNGIGKWLKAAMAQRFIAEFPAVTRINTGNAGSNAPMLKINTEMGFKAILEISAWQGDVATARKALAARG